MPGDHVATQFVTDPERALEVDGASYGPVADGCEPQRLLPGFDLEPARIVALLVTVRQTPEQAMDAPISMPAGSQAVSMRSPTP